MLEQQSGHKAAGERPWGACPPGAACLLCHHLRRSPTVCSSTPLTYCVLRRPAPPPALSSACDVQKLLVTGVPARRSTFPDSGLLEEGHFSFTNCPPCPERCLCAACDGSTVNVTLDAALCPRVSSGVPTGPTRRLSLHVCL